MAWRADTCAVHVLTVGAETLVGGRISGSACSADDAAGVGGVGTSLTGDMAAVAVAVSGVHHVVRETLTGAKADIRNAVRFTGCALICVFA